MFVSPPKSSQMLHSQQTEYRYWEVKVAPVHSDPEIAQVELDEVALEGWKLVSVDMGKAYFIRRATATRSTTVYLDPSENGTKTSDRVKNRR
jgi:hypothetical protein